LENAGIIISNLFTAKGYNSSALEQRTNSTVAAKI
jgi:hypothetical protein